MTPQETAQKINDSIYLTMLARISMALSIPVLGVTAWLALQWLDGRFDKLTVPLKNVETRVDSLELRDRNTELTIQNHSLRIGQAETNSQGVSQDLKALTGQVDDLNTNLKTLTGVLADRERRAALPAPRIE